MGRDETSVSDCSEVCALSNYRKKNTFLFVGSGILMLNITVGKCFSERNRLREMRMNILRFLCTSGHSRTWIGAWMRMMLRALWKLGDGLGPGDFWPRSVEHTCSGDGRIVPPDPWQSVGTTRRMIVMLYSYVMRIWQTTRIL